VNVTNVQNVTVEKFSEDYSYAESRFLRHPGIQDARKNVGKVGRSG
jgi:hypothetical protein